MINKICEHNEGYLYNKSITNTILKSGIVEMFPLKLEARFIFEIVLWELANPYTRIKSIRTSKEQPERPVFSDYIIVQTS